jgi:hypothetical protein
MGNIFNQDFQDFIKALEQNKVKYVLVGDYSVILHGYSRTTGDLDIWVEKTKENFQLLTNAFLAFGMSMFDMTENNFLHNPNFDVFTFGRPPVSIDIITQLKGCIFENVYQNSSIVEVDNLLVRLIHINDLLQAKKSANRPKDNDDIQHLQK